MLLKNVDSKICIYKSLGLWLVLGNVFYSTISFKFQGRYSPKLSSYTMTIPRKVSEDGSFLSHFLPHFYNIRRKKRDLSMEGLHFIIPLDGAEHQVSLWPSSDLFSPGLVVEEHTKQGNASKISFREVPDTQCHYTGVIKGAPGSRVALSTCYGLAGFVKSPNLEFIIEPSMEDSRYEYHKHYIYKREDAQQRLKNHTNCGTRGKFWEAWKQRMDWEKKYGEQIEKTISNCDIGDTSLRVDGLRRQNRAVEGCVGTEEAMTECPKDQLECPLRTPRFLEVMICVDYKVIKSFGQDLETFITTIFNMVAANFHDESVGHPIHLNLVRLLYLTYTHPRLDAGRYPPSELLQNFCDWQLEMNPLLEKHPNHHDIAIFVTSFEACQGNILGLTNMASICRLDKACAVVSEEGLLLANIITHQLGHSLGAEHDDGTVGGCSGEEPDGTRYHMSPFISLSSSAWSTCSRQCLMQFIETRMSWCMADPPDEHDFRFPDILPGQVYDAVKQCTLNFKMKTVACRTGDFCKALYCQISENKCATTGDPPAAGTPCAINMWCFNGDCVHRGQRPEAVHGQWGPWASWSACTRSCGAGVQSRYRACDNPPPSKGGRYCFGHWMTYRMCSTKPCVGYVPTFQQVQCQMTDKRPYKGHLYMWDHVKIFFEDLKCTLVCINELKNISIRSPVVIDGTPCEPGTNNVCIQGICRKVGCDYVIDSKSKEDMCGICHGPGTGCKLVQGIFTEQNIDGVVPFLQLPAGTSMIFIRELDPSSCYLIISSSINSTFYLNGPSNCDQLPGQFDCAGAVGVYDDKLGVDRIFVRGPILTPITVSVKCNPGTGSLPAIINGIKYQYALPEKEQDYAPTYSWAYLNWEPCSRACNGGSQRAKPACVEKRGGEVENKYCSDATRPDDLMRPCNTGPCTAKWWAGSWSNCDCQDDEGIMTRLVLCIKSMKEGDDVAKVVKEKECSHQPKPRVQRPCSDDKDLPRRGKRDMILDTFGNSLCQGSSNSDAEEFDLREEYLQSLTDGNSGYAHIVEKQPSEETNETKMPKQVNRNRKGRRRRKKLKANRTKVAKDIVSSRSPFEESLTDPVEQSKAMGKKIVGSAFSNEEENEKEDVSSKPVNYVRDHKTIYKNAENCEQPLDYQSTTQCTSKATTLQCTTECKAKSTCTKDFFLEHFLDGGSTKPCIPEDNEMEPADFGPLMESANNSLYKLVVVPLTPDKRSYAKTDIEIQSFGDSVFWPIGSLANKTFISGDTIFKILDEAKRRGTKPPFIDPGAH